MNILRRCIASLVLLATAGLALAAPAGAYPSRPLRFIVPFTAGSTTDQMARFLGRYVTEATSQTVIVENKGGANGIIGVEYALSQPADGYSVLITTQTTHAANPSLYKKLPYDPIADFYPVTSLITGGLVLVVPQGSPFKNVQDVVAEARKHPGKLTFGSGNSASRVGGEMLNQLASVEMRNVPYKGIPAAITDLIGGQIDLMFTDGPSILPQVRSGKVRAIGTTTPTRMPGFDNIPTIAEQGVPGYQLTAWIAAYVPKGTPPEVADKLNAMFVAIMHKPEAAKYFGDGGWVPSPRTRKDFAEFNRAEIERWARVVHAAHIEPE